MANLRRRSALPFYIKRPHDYNVSSTSDGDLTSENEV